MANPMPTYNLFPSPTSKSAQRLTQLGDRRRELLAQERDALTALETAQAEHARLQRVIADDEAKALALGDEPAVQKAAQGKLAKLAHQVDQHNNTADRLARAIVALDDEARRTTTTNCDELVAEAIESHDAARARITELVADLNQQQAALRSLRRVPVSPLDCRAQRPHRPHARPTFSRDARTGRRSTITHARRRP
jgi:hypothetical protein